MSRIFFPFLRRSPWIHGFKTVQVASDFQQRLGQVEPNVASATLDLLPELDVTSATSQAALGRA